MSAQAVLSVYKEGEVLKEVTLPEEREILLGRAEGCVIRLPDRAVSREHAVFKLLTEGGVQVEKKSDFGPIQINGAECTRALLKNGDVVSIGPYLMKLSIEKGEKNARSEKKTKPAEAVGSDLAPETPVAPGPSENATIILNEEHPAENESAPAESQNFAPPEGLELNGSQDAALSMGESPGEKLELSSFAEADADAKTTILESAPLQVCLKFKEGDASKTEFALDASTPEVYLGRGQDCTVVLNDKKCSRKNSVIRRRGVQFEIEDLGSVNGTWVNGKKIQKQDLASGDRIRIGDVEFNFQAQDKDFAEKAAQAAVFPPLEMDVPELAMASDLPGLDASATPFPEAAMASPVAFNPPPGAAPNLGFGTNAQQPSFNMDQLAGIGQAVSKKGTLLEKFKAQPRPRQLLIVLGIVALLLFLFEEEETPKKKVVAKPKPTASVRADKVVATFESLTPEQQRYVELQYQLAFDHLRNREFDKALYEVQKIFVLIPDYKEARSIERYAKEGKRKLEAIEEEKRKKEEEARLKAKIEQISQEIEEKVKKRDFDGARLLFSELLAIDPENPNIDRWRSEIDRYEQETVIAAERRRLQKQINEQGRAALKAADDLAAEKKYYPAIDAYQGVFDIPVSDPSIHAGAKTGIAAVEKAIQEERDPVLAEAKQLEQDGEESKAFKLYEKATQIDPKHPEGFEGMKRIRGFLHERAKAIYTEAVLAESYSDLATAKKKFEEVLDVVPSDDLYYDRAKRKLIPYVKNAVPNEGGG